MLLHDGLTLLRCEFAADLATPRAVFESLSRPSCFLNRRNIFPALVVARTVPMMHGVESVEFRPTRRVQDLQRLHGPQVRARLRKRPHPEPGSPHSRLLELATLPAAARSNNFTASAP